MTCHRKKSSGSQQWESFCMGVQPLRGSATIIAPVYHQVKMQKRGKNPLKTYKTLYNIMVNWCKSNLFWFFFGSYRFIFAYPVVLCGSHCNSADVARQSEKLAVRCQVSGHQRSQSQSSYGHLGKMRGLISVWVNMFIPWYPEKPSLDDSLKKSALFDRLIMQWSFQWSSTTSVWCLFRPSTAAVSLLLRSIMLRVTICGLKWCSICQGQTKQVRCNLGLTPTWGEQDWTNCGKLLS